MRHPIFDDPDVKVMRYNIREVEAGRRKLEDAGLPMGTEMRNGRVVLPGDTFFACLGAVIAVPIAAVVSWLAIWGLLKLATSQYSKPSGLMYVLLPIAILGVGSALCHVRDQNRYIAYPAAEIGFGLATAAQFINTEIDPFPRLLALVAGLRIVVDGVSRFQKVNETTRLLNTKIDNVEVDGGALR